MPETVFFIICGLLTLVLAGLSLRELGGGPKDQ